MEIRNEPENVRTIFAGTFGWEGAFLFTEFVRVRLSVPVRRALKIVPLATLTYE